FPSTRRYVYRVLQVRFGEDTSFGGRFRRSAPARSSTPAHDWPREPCAQAPQRMGRHKRLREVSNLEDCLYLDLWTPSIDPEVGHILHGCFHTALRTVLLFIHGTSFKWGWSDEYDGLALSALGELVVVVPNYRLHVLGFLGDGSDDAPGNVALYDQLLALNWTINYVHHFGGNSSSIVVHGYEAGARSLGLHLLSPVRNAFQNIARFILQSGSPFMPFQANSKLADVFTTLGCNSSNLSWECLRNLPTAAFTSSPVYQNLVLGPSFTSEYLPSNPGVLTQGRTIVDKEVLLGGVLYEGSFQVRSMELHRRQSDKKVNSTAFTQDVLERSGITDFDALRREYSSDSDWRGDRAGHTATRILGDVLYSCPTQYFAEYLSNQRNQVYAYLFTYKPSFGPRQRGGLEPTQYDDLDYLFGGPLTNPTSSSVEQEVSYQIIDIISTFAKSG
ncbi:unnamed protein product, partial [Ixodes hexagonus]